MKFFLTSPYLDVGLKGRKACIKDCQPLLLLLRHGLELGYSLVLGFLILGKAQYHGPYLPRKGLALGQNPFAEQFLLGLCNRYESTGCGVDCGVSTTTRSRCASYLFYSELPGTLGGVIDVGTSWVRALSSSGCELRAASA